MNTKEEVEKQWEKKSHGMQETDNLYLEGISDFKASLKAEITKMETPNGDDYQMQGYDTACAHILTLIDTCLPNKQ